MLTSTTKDAPGTPGDLRHNCPYEDCTWALDSSISGEPLGIAAFAEAIGDGLPVHPADRGGRG